MPKPQNPQIRIRDATLPHLRYLREAVPNPLDPRGQHSDSALVAYAIEYAAMMHERAARMGLKPRALGIGGEKHDCRQSRIDEHL